MTEEHQDVISKAVKNKGGTSVAPVTVNVINNSGTQLEAEQSEPEFDGREMIINVVVEEANREGPLRDTFKGLSGGGRG